MAESKGQGEQTQGAGAQPPCRLTIEHGNSGDGSKQEKQAGRGDRWHGFPQEADARNSVGLEVEQREQRHTGQDEGYHQHSETIDAQSPGNSRRRLPQRGRRRHR